MFIRAKKIKNNLYGYLVENKWKNGKVKQKVKKYVGKIIELDDSAKNNSTTNSIEIDFSKHLNEVLKDIVANEFLERGFVRKNNILKKDDIEINLSTSKIKEGEKQVVILMNGSYVYNKNLKTLLNLRPVEEETAGLSIAKSFRDAGIEIDKDIFIKLYKKMHNIN